MKNKFKIGDRVIYHNDGATYPLSNNSVATVLGISDVGLYVNFDNNIENLYSNANKYGSKPGYGLYSEIKYFELIEEIENQDYEEWNEE